MVGRDVVTRATEFALKADARWVKWGIGMPWRAALWAGVVVVVTKFSSAVIVPATDGVDKARRVEFMDDLGKGEFWVVRRLTPAFVVDGLEHTSPLAAESST